MSSFRSTVTPAIVKPFAKAPSYQDSPAIRELVAMHTYCRPAGSTTELRFNSIYLDGIDGMTIDDAGNRIVRVGSTADYPVLWSSHTDTVHRSGGTQRVVYGGGMLTLHDTSKSSCLGADCTVGVWIMRQMILRGVPGLYIFHAGEEIGGIGSSHIAKHTPGLLDGIKYAIAFDRRGTSSVITHQGSRCSSDGFGDALAQQLGKPYCLDNGGTFTDTANYVDIIPECTNLSVGYYNAHQSTEYLDVSFAAHLLERVCSMDVNQLPVLRTPGDYTSDLYGLNDFPFSAKSTGSTRLDDLVWDHPEIASIVLEELGVTAKDFQDYIDYYHIGGKTH